MSTLCYKISAILTAVTPLHIGSGRRTGVIKRTYSYLPGTFLRGAVGISLIKSVCRLDRPIVKHEDCEFFGDCPYATLFGEEFGKASSVFFRYSYPVHVKCGGTYLPAPKTLYKCRNPQCGKVYDAIFPVKKCECGEDIEQFHGFQCNRCGELSEHPIAFSRTTSTAMNRSTSAGASVGDSKEQFGTLHTVETIKKGSKFSAEILVSSRSADHVDMLKAVFTRGLEDEGIGGQKSRGLGKVRVENVSMTEIKDDDVLAEAAKVSTGCFSVRLVSPMLLGGQMLSAKSLLEGCRRGSTWLFHRGKPALKDVELKASRVESETFSGWSLKTDQRRRIEPAISAGSIFQFEADDKDEQLALGLAALEFHAVGSYKPHGCGQVTIESCR